MEGFKMPENKNIEHGEGQIKPSLLSQKEIDSAIEKAEEEARYADKLEMVSDAITNLKSLDDLDKKIGDKKLDILIAELIQDKGNSNHPQVVFESILDKNLVEKEEALMKNGGENVVYVPHSPDTTEKPSGGGDGYFIRKTENGEIGVLFDTQSHGLAEQYKKSFMKRVFELLEDTPLENRDEKIKKIDTFFSNINDAGGRTAASYERVFVEKIDNKKRVSAEFYGDAVFIVFDPLEKKFYLRGGGLIKDSESFSDLDESIYYKEGSFRPGMVVGYGLIPDPNTKEDGKAEPMKPFTMTFSGDSEVVLSSDGIVDPRTKYSGGRTLEKVLEDYIKEREINKELKLIEYFRNSLELEIDKTGDDITLIEVGAKIK